MITNINSEDKLVQKTFADHLQTLGWENVYAYNTEKFGSQSLLGRDSEQDVVLKPHLRAALHTLNPHIPAEALEQAIVTLTAIDNSRSLVQHNKAHYELLRDGVPVEWRDAAGNRKQENARVLDFRDSQNNRYVAVRELIIEGVRTPHYRKRADLVCFVNGLPLVFIELKAVYKNIRAAYDQNLTDYLTESVISHAFHHNAFLIASNGDEAKYGSITAKWEFWNEWKRTEESAPARLDAEELLNGMMEPARLLDIVENFILFDESRVGGARKIVARNHQFLGVNRAVESVRKQEELNLKYPPETRLLHSLLDVEDRELDDPESGAAAKRRVTLPLLKKADPDLGRLGVFWHTQGSGKSYSMAFFVEKVRRTLSSRFTFVVMTDRDDLDTQAHDTFVGVGICDKSAPRASSGKELKKLMGENHRFVFTLIHKFNQTIKEPYSDRDDIIVLSDEAHRTQGGKYARNMRCALPNAAFIGFTGTPLFKHDEITRRIFGDYVSRYDFQRSVEDGATVRLVYENRGEKLGIATLDLNAQIAAKLEEYDGDTDQQARLERQLGKSYEVITADVRLDKLADDFVEHCSQRWETGKMMLVGIDIPTCARLYQKIAPRWKAKMDELRAALPLLRESLAALDEKADAERYRRDAERLDRAEKRLVWMESTLIQLIVSEKQNEVKDLQKIGFDIIPHRDIMKRGFATPDGKRVPAADAFKDPNHPFRVAIVCAMWLTGFDVECLSTLYIDKPMKAHNLMQAIARANRVYPGKECGVIVDYNGVLKSLREALAQYALGDDADPADNGADIAPPIEELVLSLIQSLEEAENYIKTLGYDMARLQGAKGFARIAGIKDAVDALCTTDEARRRFEIMARAVFSRFKALVAEPAAYQFAERHDNIEAVYRKIQDRIERANIDDILEELRRIVGDAIASAGDGEDPAEAVTLDLSKINFDALREEFASRARRPHLALKDIRDLIEEKLALMLARNPGRIDFQERYQAIIDAYNNEKDRPTVEETFFHLASLAQALNEEDRRSKREGLTEEELALFDILVKTNPTKTEREKVKKASQSLLAHLNEILSAMPHWTENAQTRAEIESEIHNRLWQALPTPPFTNDAKKKAADDVYNHIWAISKYNPAAHALAHV